MSNFKCKSEKIYNMWRLIWMLNENVITIIICISKLKIDVLQINLFQFQMKILCQTNLHLQINLNSKNLIQLSLSENSNKFELSTTITCMYVIITCISPHVFQKSNSIQSKWEFK